MSIEYIVLNRKDGGLQGTYICPFSSPDDPGYKVQVSQTGGLCQTSII